jgi:hypothetical protein
MSNDIRTTVVTAGDRAYAWGALLLVASMRMNGMKHPAVVGAMGWTPEMKRRLSALGGVTICELPNSRQCVACQKPMLMGCDDVKTDWVCWADADGMFIGDCSEWLTGDSPDEIVIRRYDPVPPDFTEANLEIWRKDVEHYLGSALPKSRYNTRFNNPFIVLHRSQFPFLQHWQSQIQNVLPPDVRIIMEKGTAYFQTDESVLGSLLCFDPDAPKVTANYKANGSVDKTRYFAHFAYNPKPWQMWNAHSLKWRDVVFPVADWMVEKGIVGRGDLPIPLRRSWWWASRAVVPLAPWVWRAMKLKKRICGV